MVDRDASAAEAVAASIGDELGSSGVSRGFAADVASEADCAAMVREAEARFGKLDCLFNNAGIMMAEDGDAESTDEATIDKTFAVNVKVRPRIMI